MLKIIKNCYRLTESVFNFTKKLNNKQHRFKPLNTTDKNRICIILDKGLGDYVLFSYYLDFIVESFISSNKEVNIIADSYNVEFLKEYSPKLLSIALILKADTRQLLDGTDLEMYRHCFDVAIYPSSDISPRCCEIVRVLSPSILFTEGDQFHVRGHNILDYKIRSCLKSKDITLDFYAQMHRFFAASLIGTYPDLTIKELPIGQRILDGEYFVMNLNGNNRSQLLKINQYIDLAKMLCHGTCLKCVLIGVNRDIMNKIELDTECFVKDYCDICDLHKTVDLCSFAKFIVTSDTGIYHLALSIKTDSLVFVITSMKFNLRFIPYPDTLSKNRVNYLFFYDCADCKYSKILCWFCRIYGLQLSCAKNVNINILYRDILNKYRTVH